MTPLRKLSIVFAVQALLLLSVVGFKQYATWTAETVLLALETTNAATITGSDAVPVTYEISTLYPDKLAGEDYPAFPAYIELREGKDGVWEAVAIHDERQREYDNTVLIRGEPDFRRNVANRLQIDYGIEDVFVPENEAGGLPSGPGHTIAVEVKVDRFGNAVPRRFLIDGQPFTLEER